MFLKWLLSPISWTNWHLIKVDISLYFFSPQKLGRLFPLKGVKPSPDDRSIINDILVKTRSRMTMTIQLSRFARPRTT